jgi:asparagine synthetase B (glutamine-hydrolysing)
VLAVKSYYKFAEKIIDRPLPQRNEAAVLDEFEDLLASAVKYRQVSDVPIGAFLSGGTDSSLICALFQNRTPILSILSRLVLMWKGMMNRVMQLR